MYLEENLFAYRCDNNNGKCPYKAMPPETTDLSEIMAASSAGGGGVPVEPQVRKEEVLALRNKFPTKIPIIIKRFPKENQLPHLDKSKFLVPQEITMSQFQTIIRNRMKMSPNQTLYLLVNERSMLCLSLTLAEVYSEYAGPDGFLYITYASQEVFGCNSIE